MLEELDYRETEPRDVAILIVNALGGTGQDDLFVERVLRKMVEAHVAKAHPRLVAAVNKQRALAQKLLDSIDAELGSLKEKYGAQLEDGA